MTGGSKRVACYGVFLALALVAAYLETLIPISVGIPGVKLGLANIVTMCVLYLMGTPAAIAITTARILLSGFLFGNAFAMIYSGAGAALSMLVMNLLRATKRFSPVGISVAGGVFHNIGQLVVAALLLKTKGLMYYLPVLILSGIAAGVIIGMASGILIRRLDPVFRQMFS